MLPLHLVGVVATVAAVLLGFWQLDAWHAHRDAAARDLSSAAPVPLQRVLGPDAPFPGTAVGRPVDLAGQWVPGSSFYVSDRTMEGRPGYWVVTPVAVCGPSADCAKASALLVVRGWTARPGDAPSPPDGRVALTGWLQPAEGSGIPDPDPEDDVLPELRIADAIQRVDQDLYGGYLIAGKATPATGTAGLRPVTPDSLPKVSTATGLRNLLYALQWWVFAGFALFIWGRWARDEVERSRRSAEVAEPLGARGASGG